MDYEEFCEYWGLMDYDPYDPFEGEDIEYEAVEEYGAPYDYGDDYWI